MADVAQLAKARLIELQEDFENVKGGGLTADVQFNPETLKVSYSNQVSTPQTGNAGNGPGAKQFVAQGTTKPSLQLWFDVTAPAPPSWRAARDAHWAAREDGATERFSIGSQGGAGSPGGRGTGMLERDVAEQARITALVELAQRGDREAFAQLYYAYVDTVFR